MNSKKQILRKFDSPWYMQLQYFSLQSSTQTQPNFFSNDNAPSCIYSDFFGIAPFLDRLLPSE